MQIQETEFCRFLSKRPKVKALLIGTGYNAKECQKLFERNVSFDFAYLNLCFAEIQNHTIWDDLAGKKYMPLSLKDEIKECGFISSVFFERAKEHQKSMQKHYQLTKKQALPIALKVQEFVTKLTNLADRYEKVTSLASKKAILSKALGYS